MCAVAASQARALNDWCDFLELGSVAFAGRGLESKPPFDEDIVRALEAGKLTMPLWGVSLDRAVAERYGTRFLFQLEGPFHGVACWRESGAKACESEIVTGGVYDVVALNHEEGRTHAVVQEAASVSPPTSH